MKFPKTASISWALAGFAFATAGAAAPERPEVTSVSVSSDPASTRIAIRLSGKTAYTLEPATGHLDIEFPTAGWSDAQSNHGQGAGTVADFHREVTAHGVKIVFRTTAVLHVDSVTPTETEAGESLVFVVSPPTPPGTVAAPDNGPLVIQGSGYFAPAVTATQPPVKPAQPQPECTASMRQTGTLNGAPVYAFTGCAK